MNPIESKEIRGLNLRTIIVLIGCTVSIVASVVGTYFSLRSDISSIKSQRINDDKYNDLRMRTMEANIEALETRIDNLRSEVVERHPGTPE